MVNDCAAAFLQGKCGFEDWHKLYITSALTSVTLQNR